MENVTLEKIIPRSGAISLEFIEQSFDRVTGSKLIAGNDARLLKDAAENYPAWLGAIENAEDRIFFESYIIHEDKQGALFADALIKKAKEGVDVKLIYDWMGGFGKTSLRYWRNLKKNGVDVRCYNPPKFTDPLAVFSRDHRKSLIVDGKVAFISGLCVGQDWVGKPEKEIPAWRDTGVEIRGSAVAEVEFAFSQIWAEMGPPINPEKLSRREDFENTGDIALRVVDGIPSSSYIYRIDQILAAGVRESMWLTDAYFIGVPSYLQSIKDAAQDGVDVRILVPQSTDIALIRDTTRSTYRPLLEAGVRVFEWNGSMVHAKTAVFDGTFSRIGSTNLNVASWFGNYELDVIIEDKDFGRQMQEMFLEDLTNSTEIVLSEKRIVSAGKKIKSRGRKRGAGSVRKVTAGAINTATSISSAIVKQVPLGAAESRLLTIVGVALLGLALVFIFFPRIASIPVIAILLLLAFPTLLKAARSYKKN
jgi:cardiolipin synthase